MSLSIRPNIKLEKRGDHWHIIVGEAVIRTPYFSSSERSHVVGYALRAFPDAIINGEKE